MSLAGRTLVHGARVSWYRPSGPIATADGGRKVTWTLLEEDVPASIEPLTDELLQKVFGGADVATDRAMVPGSRRFQPEDAVVVTQAPRRGGPDLGAKFRVKQQLPYGGSLQSEHSELALESTTETIP